MSDVSVRVGFERLERRTLLAHVGLDLDFGDVGRGQADATLLVSTLADGKVLAVGKKRVTRLNADGSIDSSFFDTGGAQAAFGKMDWVAGDAVVSGDRLYVAGVLQSRTPTDQFSSNVVFVRAVNLADGSVVDSFGDHGFTTTLIGSLVPGPTVYATTSPIMAATPDGGFAFAVAQQTRTPTNARNGAISIYRADARGRFDYHFGGSGEVLLRTAMFVDVKDVEIDSQERIVVMHGGESYGSRLTRLSLDGSIDTTFGVGGSRDVSTDITFARYVGFTLAPDDSFVVPITAHGDNGSTGVLARLDADGIVEMTIGFSSTKRSGVGVPQIDDQGRIVVTVDDLLARLSLDLEFDPTFGGDGIVAMPTGFVGGNVALDAGGAIVVGNGEGVSRYRVGAAHVALGADGLIRVEGDESDDRITASLDGRFLNVTFGDDLFTYRAADVAGIVITAREGDDAIDVAIDRPSTINTSYGNDTIRVAGAANVSITSGTGSDFIESGDGDDTIFAGGAATILSGGGDDFIGSQEAEFYYLGSEGGTAFYLEVDMGAGDDHIRSGKAECLVWAGEGDDLIDDGDRANYVSFDRLNGEGGNDTIRGGENRDIITGGPGDDTIDPGAGMNTVDGVTRFSSDRTFQGFALEDGLLGFVGTEAYDAASVFVDARTGSLAIWRHGYVTAVDTSLVQRIEMSGRGGDDFLRVSSEVRLPATIDGGAGNDEIYGGSGADLLFGGDGNDSLFGDAGNDVMRGEAGDDYFEGGKGDDMLLGQGGADQLFGLDGNDTLFSDDGAADTVRGGAGSDRSDADEADDVLGVEVLT